MHLVTYPQRCASGCIVTYLNAAPVGEVHISASGCVGVFIAAGPLSCTVNTFYKSSLDVLENWMFWKMCFSWWTCVLKNCVWKMGKVVKVAKRSFFEVSNYPLCTQQRRTVLLFFSLVKCTGKCSIRKFGKDSKNLVLGTLHYPGGTVSSLPCGTSSISFQW